MDEELASLMKEYIAINNQEKEGNLEEIAQKYRARQLELEGG